MRTVCLLLGARRLPGDQEQLCRRGRRGWTGRTRIPRRRIGVGRQQGPAGGPRRAVIVVAATGHEAGAAAVDGEGARGQGQARRQAGGAGASHLLIRKEGRTDEGGSTRTQLAQVCHLF